MKLVTIICASLFITGCAQMKETVSLLNPKLGETFGQKPYIYEAIDGETDQRLIVIKAINKGQRFSYRQEAVSLACIDEIKPEILAEKDNDNKSTLKIIVWCQHGLTQQIQISEK